jgi:hypothetical protein
VKNSSDDTLDVSLSFDKIKISISWWCNSFWFGGGIHATDLTLSLAWDNNMFYIWWLYPLPQKYYY